MTTGWLEGIPWPLVERSTALSTRSQKGLVSNEFRLVAEVTNYVIICGLISFFGIGANIVNIIVFIKQGFKDSITISLLGLAVADLACLVTMFWTSICFNPLFANSKLPFDSLDLMYLSGGWPHVIFNRVTSFITVFITLERCLCIILPLKVKTIITPNRTKLINIGIFVFMLGVNSPFYYANRLEWMFDSSRNRSLLLLTFAEYREEVEIVIFHAQSSPLSAASLLIVIICTIRLVIKLNEKTKWRQASTSQTTRKQESTSGKDKKVVKMVTLISTIFIICFMPGTLNMFMMAYESDFSFTGRYKNIFFVVWSISFVLETVNSSVNIFVYFSMSTKYRTTLIETFCGVSK